MHFAHDTERALAAAAALVNTSPEADRPDGTGIERLPDQAALAEFLVAWDWTGRSDADGAELSAVHEVRARLLRLWHVDLDEAVELINALLREGGAVPQLVRHDGWDYHVHATSPHAPLADRMAVEAAMAMTDVVRMEQWDRLQVCAGTDCGNVFVDLSRNRSRRYCDGSCGNRANVAAYRARRGA